MSNGAKIGLSLLCIPAGLVLSAWALSLLWAWFVVPVTHLPNVTGAQALGLSAFVSAISPSGDRFKKDEREVDYGRMIGAIFVRPFFLVAFGAIVRWFM